MDRYPEFVTTLEEYGFSYLNSWYKQISSKVLDENLNCFVFDYPNNEIIFRTTVIQDSMHDFSDLSIHLEKIKNMDSIISASILLAEFTYLNRWGHLSVRFLLDGINEIKCSINEKYNTFGLYFCENGNHYIHNDKGKILMRL